MSLAKTLFNSLEIGADYLWQTYREDIDEQDAYVFRLRSRRLTEGSKASCEVSGTFFSIIKKKTHPDFGKPRTVCQPAYHHAWNEITSALTLWSGAAPQASPVHAHFYCRDCDKELDNLVEVSPCCYDDTYTLSKCDGGEHDDTCTCVTCEDAR